MYGARKRQTHPPDLYNPTIPYQMTLPVSDFDLSLDMGESVNESFMSNNGSNTTVIHNEDTMLQTILKNMNEQFAKHDN